MNSSKAESLKFRLMVIERLRLLKKAYTYGELAKHIGVAETVLCRYVKGSIIPNDETARVLWKSFLKLEPFESVINRRIIFDGAGFINLAQVIHDPYTLRRAAEEVYIKFSNRNISKILTVATDGIPIATAIATTFGIPLVVAKNVKEVGFKDFIEETYTALSPVATISLYIPTNLVKRGERILLVDDMARTGRTLQALINLARKAKAIIEGIFILVAIGEEWRRRIDIEPSIPIEVGATIKPR